MHSEELTLHGFVSGRVQGVFFRAEAQKVAMKLGLLGWVRNVADGRVEILICGSKWATDAMREWLSHGPPLARVVSLELDLIEPRQVTGFQIRG